MGRVKIKKGMSNVTDFLEQPVYVRFPYIQLDLQSIRSHLGFYLTQLMKKEMQDTASSYREDEVWEYLVDNYDLSDLKYLLSYTRKEYLLTNQTVLAYASMMATSQQLKQDLNLISTVLRYRENMLSIEGLLANIKNNTRPRRLSPSGYVVDGHIEYRPKYDITKASILETAGNGRIEAQSLHEVYYDYLTIAVGVQENDWHFLKGLNRKVEAYYLQGILDGHIRATTEVGKQVQDYLIKEQVRKGKNLLYIETVDARLALADNLFNELTEKGYELRGLNDFVIYYSQKPADDKTRQKHEVEVLTGVYVWDYDNEVELPVINRLLGLTGEFSRINRSNHDYPTYILDAQGDLIEMWRVEDTYDISYEDLDPGQTVSKQMSTKVNTLYNADRLTDNPQLLKHVETKRYETQLELYYKYTYEYNNLM